MIRKWIALFMAITMLLITGCAAKVENEATKTKTAKPEVNLKEAAQPTYFFPSEEATHEGTWLTWPHKYAYKQTYYFGEEGINGEVYVEMLEPIWIEITKALYTGENVHINVYNEEEQDRVANLLKENDVDLTKIDFVVM